MLSSSNFSYLKNNLETKAFLFFSICFCLAFQNLSYLSPWTETEIYPVHSSHYLWTENMMNFLFSLKPVFYFILYLSSLFSDWFSLLPMTVARFLFALNGLLILALMYLYIKKKTSQYNAILAILLLASANIFLDRGFRIRSDLLSTSFSLIALWLTLNIKSPKDRWKLYTAIPLWSSVLLISPKGIYWLLFTLCLMIHDLKHKVLSRCRIIEIGLGICYVFCFLSFIYKDPFFFKAISESTMFYLSDIKETYSFIQNRSWMEYFHGLSHISLFVERNLLIVLMAFVKLLFVIYSTMITKQKRWDLSDLFFFLLMAILLFHPQQKLFLLCALMPFVCISFFTDWQWNKLINHIYSLRFKTWLLISAFIYSFFYISWFNYKIYMKKNNRQQKQLIGQLNDFYKDTDPAIVIFDNSCLLYKIKSDCKYILDDPLFDKKFQSYLKQKNFDIILGTRHIDLWNLVHYQQKPFQYINIKNHIYYKALIVDLNLPKALDSSHTTNFLKGTTILQPLLSSVTTTVSEAFRQYSYFFLDHHNKIINRPKHNPPKNCHKKINQILILQSGCSYRKEEFFNGLIPIKTTPNEKKKLALFYLPWPVDLSDELSLRALFRYDMWF